MAAFQCPNCDYVYDEAIGAPREGYPAGTSWDDESGKEKQPASANK